MRVPLYVEVESGGTDRAVVTKAMQDFVIPIIVRRYVRFQNKIVIATTEYKKLYDLIGPCEVKLLSDVDALAKRDPK